MSSTVLIYNITSMSVIYEFTLAKELDAQIAF